MCIAFNITLITVSIFTKRGITPTTKVYFLRILSKDSWSKPDKESKEIQTILHKTALCAIYRHKKNNKQKKGNKVTPQTLLLLSKEKQPFHWTHKELLFPLARYFDANAFKISRKVLLRNVNNASSVRVFYKHLAGKILVFQVKS